MRFSFSKKAFLLTGLLLAGITSLYAQRGEISLTDGGCLNLSEIGKGRDYTDVAFDHMFTLKAGLLFPNRAGIGLFYERAHFSAKETLYLNGSNQPGKYELAVAAPQHTIGLELYAKAFVSNHSYLRFGALFGYAMARIPDPGSKTGYMESEDFGYNSGLDISYVFPLAQRLSGVLNTGFRYGTVHYGPTNSGGDITTVSFPLTIGLSYKFAGRSGSSKRIYEEGSE